MRRLFVSEMDADARLIADRYDIGLETIVFCSAERMEDDAFVDEMKTQLGRFRYLSMHGAYYELSPCAIDSRILEVSSLRYRQIFETAGRIGAERITLHTGYNPYTYFPEWFIPKSVEFWKRFMREISTDISIALENVLDSEPEYLLRICDGVNDPRFRICLDVGHAQVYSKETPIRWVQKLGDRIAHVHLHNNDGQRDIHAAADHGVIELDRLLEALDTCAGNADICIESMEADRSVKALEERGLLCQKNCLRS